MYERAKTIGRLIEEFNTDDLQDRALLLETLSVYLCFHLAQLEIVDEDLASDVANARSDMGDVITKLCKIFKVSEQYEIVSMKGFGDDDAIISTHSTRKLADAKCDALNRAWVRMCQSTPGMRGTNKVRYFVKDNQ